MLALDREMKQSQVERGICEFTVDLLLIMLANPINT
jgi:hypothetical protein